MEVPASERRISRRLQFKTALRVRVWKAGSTEQKSQSENLSETGIFFAIDSPLTIGSAVEILLRMPEEVTGNPTTEWRCTGHVVHLEPVESPPGRLGVGVKFDCYEILRSKAAPWT
jgi:hypothetical protein